MIITHSGRFHADEVFAVAMILCVEQHDIIRTRDETQFAQGDWILDVGAKYLPEEGWFDHHQNEFTETRSNGVPYATSGLIWRHLGQRVVAQLSDCQSSYEFAQDWVDRRLIEDLDALDNGLYLDSERPSVSMLVALMNADSEDEAAQEVAFREALGFAKGILLRFIQEGLKQAQAQTEFEQVAEFLAEGVVVLREKVSYKEVIRHNADIRRVVYPRGEDQFGVYCNGFDNHLPVRYRGLRDHELNQVAGIDDGVFCHKSGFMAVCLSQASALQLAYSQ